MTHRLTTLQVSIDARDRMAKFKEYQRETWNEVLLKLLTIAELQVDNEGELSSESLRAIEDGRKQYRAGKGKTLSQLMKELGDA